MRTPSFPALQRADAMTRNAGDRRELFLGVGGWKRNVYACNEEGVRRWRLQQLE